MDKFKKFEFKVDEINENDCIDVHNIFAKQLANTIDEMLFKFLNEKGYKIEKPYTEEQVLKIKKQLDQENKYVDYIEIQERENERIISHFIPFIGDKNRPLSLEDIEDIKQRYIKLKGLKSVM